MNRGGLFAVLMSIVTVGSLVACHSPTRDNLLDPKLTPAVTLSVQVDSTAGVAHLTWSGFSGDQGFASYRIWRRITGLIAADSIATVADVEQTALADSTITPDQDYVYWVEVVNDGGLAVPSNEVAVGSYTVIGVQLSTVAEDNLIGQVSLKWRSYDGPGFNQYEVWRTAFGQPDTLLQTIGDLADTSWFDASPQPRTEYTYWIVLAAAGKRLESSREEISYQLPPIELEDVAFSAETASAALRWSAYVGPRFASYQIRRRSGELTEQLVATIADPQATSFTDSLLDGNTDYIYRIDVETTWDQIRVPSNERNGRFYELVEIIQLPPQNSSALQAVDMAFDGADSLYVAVLRCVPIVSVKGFRLQV